MTNMHDITTADLEAELDTRIANLARFRRSDHSRLSRAAIDEATETCTRGIGAIVETILDREPATLGDLRLQAKALLTEDFYRGWDDPRLGLFIAAVELLPQRLWTEPLGAA